MAGGEFEGTRHLEYDLSGLALELSKEINHVYGNSETLLTRPGEERWLVLAPETYSSWRIRPGDYVAKSSNLHDKTGDPAGDNILGFAAAHGFTTGDGPYKLTEDNTLPSGLDTTTLYWVIVVTTTKIQLATSWQNALDGTVVDIVDDGTAPNTIGGVPAAPAASVTDGYASLSLDSGSSAQPVGQPCRAFVMSAPEKLTVVGAGAADILTYWWLP